MVRQNYCRSTTILMLVFICLDLTSSNDECIEVSLPQCPSYRDDRAAYRSRAEPRRGKRHFGAKIRRVLDNKFKNCGRGCLHIKNVGYILCDVMPTCTVQGDERSTGTHSPPLTTRETTVTEDSVAQPPPGAAGKHKSCNGWGIGMLALGIFLGSFSMAVVCVFLPSLHSKITMKLDRRFRQKRKPPNGTQPNLNYQQTTEHPTFANTQHNEPAMYLELDQNTEMPEYQTLSRYDGPAGHVYTPLDMPEHNIYNAIGDENAGNLGRDGLSIVNRNSSVTYDGKFSSNSGRVHTILNQIGANNKRINDRNKTSTDVVPGKTLPLEGAHYFILEPEKQTDKSNNIYSKALPEEKLHNYPIQPEYFRLEPKRDY